MKQPIRIFIFLLACLALLAFRTFYGLNNRFWDEDEKHIYLLGLELFSFRHWPYFGADIIHTATQIPGALQSFLVGGAFFFLQKPEAPFLVVNVLSLSGFILFAFYLNKHFPKYTVLSLLAWLTSLPWALEYTTHVYNPSYLLLPEVLFFIALFESLPELSKGILRLSVSMLLMGLSLGTIAQLHLSWPILLPFVLLTVWETRKSFLMFLEGSLLFVIGFALPSLLLLPTIRHFGWHSILQMGAENSQFNAAHAIYFFNNLVRLICYASYESFLFIGESMRQREEFLLQMIMLLPMFLTLTALTAYQILYFVYAFIRMCIQNNRQARVSLALFLFALLTASAVFMLSSRPPVSRNLYLLFPLSLWCMFFTIDFFVRQNKWGKYLFHALILVGLSYHALVSYNRYRNFPEHSLYSNRKLVVKSLHDKDPYIFETPRYSQKITR